MEATEALEAVDTLLRFLAKRYACRLAPFDDLLQEARVAVIQALPRFDRERATITAFARVYGRTAMLRYLRDRCPLIRKPAHRWERGEWESLCARRLDESAARPQPDEAITNVESEIYVEQLLARLRPTWRTMIRMRLDGWSDTQIGAALGISMMSAWEHRKRAERLLAHLIDAERRETETA